MSRRWVYVGAACLLGLACRGRAPEPAEALADTYGAVVLSATSSAYHASLAADGDVFHLLTSRAAYRLEPGRAPVETSLDLGFGATMTPSALVFWSDGAIVEAPKKGGPPRRRLGLPERPQLFVAAGDALAWLARSGERRFSLQTSKSEQVRTLYDTRGNIDAVTAIGEAIFFVERPAGSDWRIGRVPIAGGPVAFTPPRPGRAPAMLAGRKDLVYYDGNRFEVRRLSLDLHHEETVASDIVCSPLAVTDGIYCAQVEGIVELRAGAAARRLVSTPRLITALAASNSRLFWVIDAGADRLEVRSLDLGAAAARR